MKNFNKSNLKALREQIQKALDEAGFENLEFNVGNCRFDPAEATFQLKTKIKGVKTTGQTILQDKIRRLNLVQQKGDMKLVDYKPRNYKLPFIMEQNGKRYKLTEYQAKAYFAA